jgi:putative hydrolase of the HAD superfamily
MPAHNIEAVLLDVGGVLVMPSTDLIRDVLTEHGLEADDERLDRTAYRALQAFDGTQGDDEVLEAAFVATYLTELGLEQSDVSLAKMRSALFIPMWPVRPLGDGRKWLSVLGKSGVPIVVVSNATVAVEEWLRNEGVCQVGPGEGTEVAAVITSEGAGFAKPDPRIFNLALEVVGTAPENAVHVGDSLWADVRGAQGAGIRPLHFDPYRFCAHDDHAHVGSIAEVVELVRR